MENLPTVLKIRKYIDELGFCSYSPEKGREINKCYLLCKKFDKPAEYIAQNIAPGWLLEPEDLIAGCDLPIEDEENGLPYEEFLKLKLVLMWFHKLFYWREY